MANTAYDTEELKKLRKKIFLTGYKGGYAHLASCYSCIEMLYAFYVKGILKYDLNDPKWPDRDRFILSKGHAGLALFSVMEKIGMLSHSALTSYLTEHSLIGGEPCMRDCEWIEGTTGSLGHGLSMGLGIAMALKMNKSKAKVYVMLGDGELEEGSVWEAIMTAPVFGADNLVAVLDCNGIQKMDFVEKIIGLPRWKDKLESFGWDVSEVDGHDIETFSASICAENRSCKPKFVIANTVKGKGVSLMENNPDWHFRLPNKKELKVFKTELGITDDELV